MLRLAADVFVKRVLDYYVDPSSIKSFGPPLSRIPTLVEIIASVTNGLRHYEGQICQKGSSVMNFKRRVCFSVMKWSNSSNLFFL